jgi:hypothetical protein
MQQRSFAPTVASFSYYFIMNAFISTLLEATKSMLEATKALLKSHWMESASAIAIPYNERIKCWSVWMQILATYCRLQSKQTFLDKTFNDGCSNANHLSKPRMEAAPSTSCQEVGAS